MLRPYLRWNSTKVVLNYVSLCTSRIESRPLTTSTKVPSTRLLTNSRMSQKEQQSSSLRTEQCVIVCTLFPPEKNLLGWKYSSINRNSRRTPWALLARHNNLPYSRVTQIGKRTLDHDSRFADVVRVWTAINIRSHDSTFKTWIVKTRVQNSWVKRFVGNWWPMLDL